MGILWRIYDSLRGELGGIFLICKRALQSRRCWLLLHPYRVRSSFVSCSQGLRPGLSCCALAGRASRVLRRPQQSGSAKEGARVQRPGICCTLAGRRSRVLRRPQPSGSAREGARDQLPGICSYPCRARISSSETTSTVRICKERGERAISDRGSVMYASAGRASTGSLFLAARPQQSGSAR